MICEFDGEDGYTVIKPDHSEGRTATPFEHGGCNTPGCYSDKFLYNQTKEQIEDLIAISATCEQAVKELDNEYNFKIVSLSYSDSSGHT